jgi:hypothetical protein
VDLPAGSQPLSRVGRSGSDDSCRLRSRQRYFESAVCLEKSRPGFPERDFFCL